MRYLKDVKLVCIVWLVMILKVACVTEGNCGKDFEPRNGYCYTSTTKTSTMDGSLSNQDGSFAQEGGDGELDEDTVTGIGDFCTGQMQCRDKKADYCMIDPSNGEGYCTIKGCNNTADSCPDGYRCCMLPESFGGAVCLTTADYELAKSLNACGT